MQDDLNAIVLLIVPLVTLILLWKFGRFSVNFKKVVKAILFLLFTSVLNIITSTHLCDAGTPFCQWLVPAVCGGAIIIGMEEKKIKRTSVIVMFVVSIVLSQHFVHLVHEDNYIGNPNPRINSMSESLLECQKELLKTDEEFVNRTYPAGWIEESLKELEEFNLIVKGPFKKIEIHKLWHTNFTGIYGATDKQLGVWYPGGILQDAIGKIVIKER